MAIGRHFPPRRYPPWCNSTLGKMPEPKLRGQGQATGVTTPTNGKKPSSTSVRPWLYSQG